MENCCTPAAPRAAVPSRPEELELLAVQVEDRRLVVLFDGREVQHAFSDSLLNELRVGDTRRTVGRAAATLRTSASDALGLPGITSSAEFSDSLPTFPIGGYQQIGSPPNTVGAPNTTVGSAAFGAITTAGDPRVIQLA